MNEDDFAILKTNLFDPDRHRHLLVPWIASLSLRLNERLLAERKKRKRKK